MGEAHKIVQRKLTEDQTFMDWTYLPVDVIIELFECCVENYDFH